MALGTLNGIYNIAADPELRFVGQNSTAVVSIRAAANRARKLDNGEFETLATHWINLQAWGAEAEYIANNASKGDRIKFVGSPETQEWEDKNTGDRRSKDVVNIEFFRIFKKDNNRQQSVSQTSQQNRQSSQGSQGGGSSSNDPWGSSPQSGSFGGGFNGGDDEPPF